MVKKTNKINIVMVGAGMVSQTHLKALIDLKDQVNIQGILVRNNASKQALTQDIVNHFGNQPLHYQNAMEIAHDPFVDCALILTPPNARVEITQILASKGKHILMEKPIERTVSAAQKIVQICEDQKVKLGIVFQHRMRAASITLKEKLQQNCFGKIGIVEIDVPWWREQSYYDEPGRGTYSRDGGGVLISQAIHTLDLALFLVGPVSQVHSFASTTDFHQMESEDYVSAGLQFANGAIGSLRASTASYPGAAESIKIHCQKAVLYLASGVLTVHWRDGRQEAFGSESTTGGGADPMAFTHDWHRAIIEDFLNAITKDQLPCISGREALAVHHLIHALIESSKQGTALSVTGD